MTMLAVNSTWLTVFLHMISCCYSTPRLCEDYAFKGVSTEYSIQLRCVNDTSLAVTLVRWERLSVNKLQVELQCAQQEIRVILPWTDVLGNRTMVTSGAPPSGGQCTVWGCHDLNARHYPMMKINASSCSLAPDAEGTSLLTSEVYYSIGYKAASSSSLVQHETAALSTAGPVEEKVIATKASPYAFLEEHNGATAVYALWSCCVCCAVCLFIR